VPDVQNAGDVHVQLKMPGGFSLEVDTATSARLWHAGWRADAASARVVGFLLPSREAVDERYAEVTGAGYAGRQLPSMSSGAPATRSSPIPTAMMSA